ncbi:cation transport protein-domain-containing protein [Fennellomyces sp. T-0311]|nr:cation transport protein-domain-containing protein [Fennellomyces sp. T-0311]
MSIQEKLWQKCRWVWHHKINFLELHYAYFAVLCFIVSGLFYCQPGTQWDYIDALFMAVTTVTNTGLNTIDMSQLSYYQLLLMFFVSILGSQVAVSVFIVLVRKHYFSKRFKDVLLYNQAQRLREDNQRRFNRNLADVQSKVQQQASQNMQAARSMTMPTPRRGVLPRLRSSATMALLHPLQALKQHEHHNENPEKTFQDQRQRIYEKLRILRDNEDRERTLNSSPSPTTTVSPKFSYASATDIIRAETPQNIAFADNIDKQRSEARKEFEEQDKPYANLLRKIAEGRHPDSPMEDVEGMLMDVESEQNEIKQIMSKPTLYKHELTRRQRYCIGGAEYRAIDFLSKAIPVVYFTVTILFSFAMRIYIAADSYAQEALRTSNPNGPVDPWFFSFFTCFSAYNNLGLSPLDASLVPFVNAPAPILLITALILLGNVAYPIALRFFIWCCYKMLPKSRAMDRETLRYLLDHPRRCYTSLFPASQTWWLVFTLITINLCEFAVFLATNYWLPVLNGIPWASRCMIAFFQGVATRNAGFTTVSIFDLNPGTIVIYIVAMYISVYPVGISIRNSNVYQERELGIYSDPDDENDEASAPTPSTILRRFPTMSSVVSVSKKLIPKPPSFYVITQLQRQLAQEICWVIVGIFLVCVLEAESIMRPSPITALTVMYECVSAFGNAGSSTGYPGVTVSQAGRYRNLSKLVICILMYRGRHRGLPSAIDHAVLLPSEQLDEKEERECRLRQKHAGMAQHLEHPNARWRARSHSLNPHSP